VLVDEPTEDVVAADDRRLVDRHRGLGVGGTKPEASVRALSVVVGDIVVQDHFEGGVGRG
jgi:hypothetical protein